MNASSKERPARFADRGSTRLGTASNASEDSGVKETLVFFTSAFYQA
jgi:hypothetical protein